MTDGAQLLEKNRFLPGQNRSTLLCMRNELTDAAQRQQRARRTRLVLLLMAIALAAATVAPVAVLAG